MKSYKFAVAWIARNDSAGDNHSAEEIFGYISTALVADLYEKEQIRVGQDVHHRRWLDARAKKDAETLQAGGSIDHDERRVQEALDYIQLNLSDARDAHHD